MINPVYISMAFMGGLIVLVFILSAIDYFKKRKLTTKPFISFIIPCYNEGKGIEPAIKSINESYDNFELLICDDKSKDDSIKQLEKLRKKYKFKIYKNGNNKGKAKTINDMFPYTKGEIIFVLDGDTLLNKKALEDILRRFEYDKKVGAISCPHNPINKGFLAAMQRIEYKVMSMLHYSHNVITTIGAWGGCLAIKRNVFEKVNGFSENMIIEDVELALKVVKAGYKVEQSQVSVETDVPTSLKSWWKQKIRWNSGAAQCFMTHTKVFLKNPIYMIFMITYVALIILSLFSFGNFFMNMPFVWKGIILLYNVGLPIAEIIIFMWGIYKSSIYTIIIFSFIFLSFSVPYVLMTIDKPKKLYRILNIIPYSLIYYPMYSTAAIYGICLGFYRYFELKDGRRAW